MRAPYLVLAAALLGGCNQGQLHDRFDDVGSRQVPDLGTPRKIDRIVQVTKPEVDVLWVLDNSCSMAEEQAALAENFPAFMKFFQGSGLDWHIGLISTDTDNKSENGRLIGKGGYTYLDANTPNAAQIFDAMTDLGTGGSASERGLLAAFRAINMPTQEHKQRNSGFFRDNAALHIVVISDEDDQSAMQVTRAEFTTFLSELKADEDIPVTFSSIVGPTPQGCNGANGSADPAWTYLRVTADTGGLAMSICDEDWVPLLEELGLHAAGLRREYFLTEVPVPGTISMWVDDDGTIKEGVDASKITRNHTLEELCEEQGSYGCFSFEYNPSRNSVIMEQRDVPGELAEVFIQYDLLSGLQPEEDDLLNDED